VYSLDRIILLLFGRGVLVRSQLGPQKPCMMKPQMKASLMGAVGAMNAAKGMADGPPADTGADIYSQIKIKEPSLI